ncbi:NAD(P)-binding protein [Auricularia subglabra TFB-10046 SS5]|nr:NAD(P)-binding protein [Auricularia subglabra TFB-10046 SS5]
MFSSVVFVTGASRGIGLAIATALLSQGQRITTFSRSLTPELKALGERYKDSALIIQGDVTDSKAAIQALSQTSETFGRLDGLVLNAGMGIMGTIASTPVEDWRRNFEVNVFSMIPLLQAALPLLRISNGRVILVSSAGSVTPPPGLAAYAATKAALNCMAKSLAGEEPNITAVAIHPGLVVTDMVHELINDGAGKVPEPVIEFFRQGVQEVGKEGPRSGVLPEVPGKRIAWLSLHAPKSLNGQYVVYNAPEVEALVKA